MTRCYSSVSVWFAMGCVVFWLYLMLGLLGGSTANAQAVNASIPNMKLVRSDDGLLLSAQINFELPSVVEDALSKGVALVFVVEAELTRERWYWYDKKLSFQARQMRLSYQPLTRRWRLSVTNGVVNNTGSGTGLGTGLPQYFDTLPDALARIRRITEWKIADFTELELDTTPTVELRFKLDVSQLPRPFQIGLIGNGDWTINASKSVRVNFDATR